MNLFKHFFQSLVVALNLFFRGLIAFVVCLTVFYFDRSFGFIFSVLAGVVFVLYPLLQIRKK